MFKKMNTWYDKLRNPRRFWTVMIPMTLVIVMLYSHIPALMCIGAAGLIFMTIWAVSRV